MKTRSTLLFLLAASLLVGACTGGAVETATPQPTTNPTPNPTAPPATPTTPNVATPADAVRHTFVEGNFSVALPAGWKVAGPFDTPQFRMYAIGAEAGQSGGPGMSQIIMANEGALTIEQFAQLQCSVCPLNPIEDATLGGMPAKRIVIGGDSTPSFEWRFITHAGKLIGFSIRPVGDGLEWVLPSVQFIAPTVGQTQTYRNETVGLEMQLPADWQVQSNTPPAGPVMLDTLAYIYSQPLPTLEPKGGEGPVEGVKIDVIAVYDSSINQSVEQALAWFKSGLGESNSQIISEGRVILAGGQTAVRVHTTGPLGEGVTLLAKVNDVIVLLGGSGKDLSLFDAAANTLRAIPPVSGAPSGFICTVAYTNINQLFCLGEGGAPIEIAQSVDGNITSPAISPDGAWVAYLINHSLTSELWAVNVSGLQGNNSAQLPRLLLVDSLRIPNPDPQLINSPQNFEWRAGTHTLIFNTRFAPLSGEIGLGGYTNDDVWRVNVDTGEVSNLVPQGVGGPFTLSPNGNLIAISGATNIQLMNADGSNRRTVLEFPSIITYSEYQYKPTVTWSGDSAFFSLIVPSADPLAADTSGTLYRVNADGSVQTLWTRPGNFVFSGPLDISPDGQRVVSGHNDSTNAINLRLVNTDDANEMVFVTSSLAVNGWGWSPDSQTYVYGIVPDGGNFLLRANGAVEPFGAGITVVGVQWADTGTFFFTGVTGEAVYGLYLQRLGEPNPQLMVGGLSAGVMFDLR